MADKFLLLTSVNFTMSPLEEYQKMMAAPRMALEGRVKKRRAD